MYNVLLVMHFFFKKDGALKINSVSTDAGTSADETREVSERII